MAEPEISIKNTKAEILTACTPLKNFGFIFFRLFAHRK